MFFEILNALFGPASPETPEQREKRYAAQSRADFEERQRRDEEARERQRWQDQRSRDSEALRKSNNRGYYDPI